MAANAFWHLFWNIGKLSLNLPITYIPGMASSLWMILFATRRKQTNLFSAIFKFVFQYRLDIFNSILLRNNKAN